MEIWNFIKKPISGLFSWMGTGSSIMVFLVVLFLTAALSIAFVLCIFFFVKGGMMYMKRSNNSRKRKEALVSIAHTGIGFLLVVVTPIAVLTIANLTMKNVIPKEEKTKPSTTNANKITYIYSPNNKTKTILDIYI